MPSWASNKPAPEPDRRHHQRGGFAERDGQNMSAVRCSPTSRSATRICPGHPQKNVHVRRPAPARSAGTSSASCAKRTCATSRGAQKVSEPLKKLLLSNISRRAAESVQEEMAFLGHVKMRDVEAAQFRIIDAVRKLGGRRAKLNLILRRQRNRNMKWSETITSSHRAARCAPADQVAGAGLAGASARTRGSRLPTRPHARVSRPWANSYCNSAMKCLNCKMAC
jgi:hypothetical protein